MTKANTSGIAIGTGLVWAALAIACGSGASGPALLTTLPDNPLSLATATPDWTMYGHDPSRTNCSGAERAVSAASVPRLARAWSFDLPTNGQPTSSGPVLAGGLVYVGSSVASGANYFGLDAATGALVWSADLGHGSDERKVPCGSVGLGSTAAVAAGLLVVGGGDDAYYGLAAGTGTVRWRHDLLTEPNGFAWASPLLVGGRAYVGAASACVAPVPGELRALDAGSGGVLASRRFVPEGAGGASVWNSPSLAPDGRTVFVATGNDEGTHGLYEQALIALDAQTLAILQADKHGPTDQDLDFVTTPIVFSDGDRRLLVGASQKTGVFYAYLASAIGAGPIWSRSVGAIIGLAPAYDPAVLGGGTLFFGGTDGAGNGQVHAVDPGNGSDRYPPVTVGTTHGNLAVANGLLFVNTGAGGLQIFDSATGVRLRALMPSQPGDAYSGVAVAQGTVLWLSGATLNAWRPEGP